MEKYFPCKDVFIWIAVVAWKTSFLDMLKFNLFSDMVPIPSKDPKVKK